MDEFSISEDDGINLNDLIYKPPVKEKKVIKNPQTIKEPKKVESIIEKQLMKRSKNKKEIPTEEEVLNKRRMILLIQVYLLEFADDLKSFKKINLEKKNYQELSDLHKEIVLSLSTGSNVQGGVQLMTAGIKTFEMILLNFTPVNCAGLSNICTDKNVIKDMKLIILKNTSFIQTEPEQRLLYKIVTSTLFLHNFNSANGIQQNNPEVIEKINSQFVDI